MYQEPVYLTLEFTPNPNALKYAINRHIAPKSLEFQTPSSPSPLANTLLGVSGVNSVFLGRDFITITKSEDGEWDHVHEQSSKIIHQYLSEEKPLFNADFLASFNQSSNTDESLVEKIKSFLETTIRPSVALDGGDIEFDHFENGIVYVRLLGSCKGCPSSTMTLKQGIEARLMETHPEIKGVESIF